MNSRRAALIWNVTAVAGWAIGVAGLVAEGEPRGGYLVGAGALWVACGLALVADTHDVRTGVRRLWRNTRALTPGSRSLYWPLYGGGFVVIGAAWAIAGIVQLT